MCGLIGFSGKTNSNVTFLKLLLVWNSLERGQDSTGIYSPINGLHKSLVKGSHYVLYDDNNFNPDKLFIGHVRAATVGAKELANAHPFERGNYILAHNGTLRNHYPLLRKYELGYGNNYNVDSDILTGCINKADSIINVVQQIDGAAALIIYDKRKENTMYVFKNTERPLFRATDSKGNMYISSIEEPLHFLNLTKIKAFKDNTLYTIVNGEIVDNKKIKNTPYAEPVTTTYNNGLKSLDNYKNVWVRGTTTVTIKRDGGEFKIDKYNYFKLYETDPCDLNNVLVSMNNGITKISISKSYINKDDLITKENEHIYLKEDLYDAAELIAKAGEICITKTMYDDGDQGFKFLDPSKKFSKNWIKKDMFIKVTGDDEELITEALLLTGYSLEPMIYNIFELRSESKSNNTNNNQLPVNFSFPKQSNNNIIGFNLPKLPINHLNSEVDTEPDNSPKEEGDKILVDEETLENHFEYLTSQLARLVTLSEVTSGNEVLTERLKNLIEYSEVVKDELIITIKT
jgi:hypothetical protein